ncbi:MAG: PocR ligand-binding domain-containing protein [Deltaproteobacteria bacterium]|nr:PocR ligand-binding domain-containing protein [Deltaproteobacteria bacterium]MBW2220831.1 PocR ligand-binding domain-containing protein [Deltaproteobacteria bacterium]
MKLTDILPSDKWVEFEKKIHEKSGLDTNVFNTDGYRITEFKQWVNRLCPVIKDNDKGQSFICAVAHMNIAAMAKNNGNYIIEECDAGLVKLVVPIFYNDEFVGAVGACGFLLDDGEVDLFMVNKTIGLDESEIETLSNDIKNVTTEKLESIADYIKNEIDKILSAK